MDDNKQSGSIPDSNSIHMNSIPSNGSKKHKFAAIAAVIVLAVFLIFIFASYEGYVPFLKLSSSSTPYYSVANIQQLSSTVSNLQNSSGPFNLSYSLLLSLSATAGSSVFSFNLPINGYMAHYTPYTRGTADINLGALARDIASLSSSINVSSFPKALNTINLTFLSNMSYDTLCIPFSMIASLVNANISTVGAALNDSNTTVNSLFCASLNTNDLMNSTLPTVNQSTIISNLSKFSNYLSVKYLKGENYNGNSCSLLDINTTPAFESKYNTSMGFSFCFSNTYGVPLYGNFVLNLTKDSSMIMNLLNSSGNTGAAPNFSNIILFASLKSTFNPTPVSASVLSVLPEGSYILNKTMLSKLVSSFYPTQPVSTVQTPKALLSYVDSYIPGMLFQSNISYSFENNGNFYFYLNNPYYGINEQFEFFPPVVNSSDFYSYYGFPYNLTIDGQPAIGDNYTLGPDYYYNFVTLYNGSEYMVYAYAPLNNTVYLTELNNTILKMVKNLPLKYISQG